MTIDSRIHATIESLISFSLTEVLCVVFHQASQEFLPWIAFQVRSLIHVLLLSTSIVMRVKVNSCVPVMLFLLAVDRSLTSALLRLIG